MEHESQRGASNNLPKTEVEICRRIGYARRLMRRTQAQLADDLYITRSKLANLESARNALTFDLGWRLCGSLNISQLWLATGRPPEYPFITVDLSNVTKPKDDALFSEVCGMPRVESLKPEIQLFDSILRHSQKNITEMRRWNVIGKCLVDLLFQKLPDNHQRLAFLTILENDISHLRRLIDSLDFSESIETSIDNVNASIDNRNVTKPPSQDPLTNLIEEVNQTTESIGHGSKAELARYLGVARQQLNAWLSGEYEPSGRVALALKEWVELHKSKLNKSPRGATNTPEGKQTRKRKQANESKSGPSS